jgi:hypothetical protein
MDSAGMSVRKHIAAAAQLTLSRSSSAAVVVATARPELDVATVAVGRGKMARNIDSAEMPGRG